VGVFHGAVDLDVLRIMMEWEREDVASLADELIETGLATADPYDHLTLNPALCPYLLGRMEAGEQESLAARWVEAMRRYVDFLDQQRSQKTEMAATLTVLELPNLMALLVAVQRAGDAEATIGLATLLYGLLQRLGRPPLLERVVEARDLAAKALGASWSRAAFQARRTSIEQQLERGRLREALDGARELLRRAREAGETAYPGADYDLAMACWLLARVLRGGGGSEQALPLLHEAQGRFEAINADRAAEGMASVCVGERGNCLRDLGRLEEAASAYEEAILRDEQRGSERDVAVGKGQLGTVRLLQRRYREALQTYEDARERFTSLDEPGMVAVSWHQTGWAYQEAGQPEAAEDAYRQSLAINVRLGNVAGQANTLGQLGTLYGDVLGRPEEAVTFYRQAADRYVASGDEANEGRVRSNLAETLRKLRRLDEARQEVLRAIACDEPLGHASAPWMTWAILADIEADAGNPLAAAEAKRNAVARYLAYRRDGGENHDPDGRIALAVTKALLAGDPATAASLLQEAAADPDRAWLRPFLQAIQAIVAGSRDRTLAETPDLDHTMAAEILFLIETLEKRAE